MRGRREKRTEAQEAEEAEEEEELLRRLRTRRGSRMLQNCDKNPVLWKCCKEVLWKCFPRKCSGSVFSHRQHISFARKSSELMRCGLVRKTAGERANNGDCSDSSKS